MNLKHRVAQLESAMAPPGGICRHAADVRIYDREATEEERNAEGPLICPDCGLPRLARVNVYLAPKASDQHADGWRRLGRLGN